MKNDERREAVLDAITSRRSVRAYRDTPVPRPMVEAILAAAARAPSGSNIQPWHVHVLTGATKARLTAAIMQDRAEGPAEPPGDYFYYPQRWTEPYIGRRRKVGWALYGLLGIAKGDVAAARAWHDQNFDFFGAPVGLIFSMERHLEAGSFMDCGMFIQSVMIAARGFGLDTCPQAAFIRYHDTVRQTLGLPAEQLVLCGMSLGWADPAAVPNQLTAERETLERFASFMD